MKEQGQLLFKEEVLILQEAKEKLAKANKDHREFIIDYQELVENYERLLKLTSKIFKISDIQGRTLKEREQELLEAHANLQKLELSRRKLISDISHEIGTPMTSIQGYLKAMLDQVISAEEKYISLIHQKAVFVNRLMDDLYDLTTLENTQTQLKFQKVRVKDLKDMLFSKYRLDVESKGLHFSLQVSIGNDSRNDYVCIDPLRIEQVMTNLIHNATKFTSTGGKIHIEVNTKIENDKRELVIRVADSGVGIQEEALPFIFDRFFKTKGSLNKEGTGLGLAISKEIIYKHNGEIGVESQAGQGSTFYFSLPMHRSDGETDIIL